MNSLPWSNNSLDVANQIAADAHRRLWNAGQFSFAVSSPLVLLASQPAMPSVPPRVAVMISELKTDIETLWSRIKPLFDMLLYAVSAVHVIKEIYGWLRALLGLG